ncbi:MAG: AAA family ATPase [Gammaproteobacteria bacterium SG8_47]|nr:MAG: AAA family ATPase [Gammaproteobacteria bacterium SG8_47]
MHALYLNHFGLREHPFTLTPDTSYFFSYGHYSNALNTLVVALRTGEGFIKVTGEVGTGKTLLCRKLLNVLEEECVTAYIPNPLLSPSALTMAVAEELGLQFARNIGAHRVLKLIVEQLITLRRQGKSVVLCLDEVQAMPSETLEAVRLLTNLETEKHKLLQVVMFGQPELDQRLAHPAIRQLKQRISFAYTLKPIEADGLNAYVDHRLRVAGFSGAGLFSGAALRRIYRASAGVPRLVNILCHKALMVAYGRGERLVSTAAAQAAIRDTQHSVLGGTRRWHLWPALGTAGVVVVGLAAALLVG